MQTENNSGNSRGGFGYGAPRLQQKESKRVNALDTSNGNGRHHSTEGGIAEGSSQQVEKKRRRENEGSSRSDTENEEGAGPEINFPETGLSKAMEDDIQQVRQRVECFTHQVSDLLEAGKSYFLDASTAFEEGILQLHQKILETWEENIGGLRNVDIVNEENCTRLREARDVLEKLQASASSVRRLQAAPV